MKNDVPTQMLPERVSVLDSFGIAHGPSHTYNTPLGARTKPLGPCVEEEDSSQNSKFQRGPQFT